MSEGQSQNDDQTPKPVKKPMPEMASGFCSATCTDKPCLLHEIGKSEVRTSDVFTTCNLPKRFEHPHWFNGYGCQVNKQHPFYRTSSGDYGYYPPDLHSIPSVYFPISQEFSNSISAAGVYRNYSLNTGGPSGL